MITCRPRPVDAADAAALLRAYVTELVNRYYGRTMPAARIDEARADLTAEGLAVFLVAYLDDPTAGTRAVGCVGLRLPEPSVGEVKRMYVAPQARRLGVARALLDTLEEQARARGATLLRLDTRSDLVEARALYARHGYREVPRFNDDPYAGHWFAKKL